MTIERALELLTIEKTCVESAAGKWRTPEGAFESTGEVCDRDCANCKYVQNDEELIEMYDFAIGIFKKLTLPVSLEDQKQSMQERMKHMQEIYTSAHQAFINYKRRLENDASKNQQPD